MEFALTEEQGLLRDSLARFVDEHYGLEQRRRLVASAAGFSHEYWAMFAELGWLTIPFPEDAGGFGGKLEDACVVMEQFGRGLVLEPWLATVMLAGQILSRSGHAQAGHEILPAIMAGEVQAALAAVERQSGESYHDVLTTAVKDDDTWLLQGTKCMVLNGGAADWLVVTARTAGAQHDRQGISLFLVAAGTPGVEVAPLVLMDGSRAATVHLRSVRLADAALLGQRDAGWALLAPVLQEARVAVCAEMVGIMDALYRKTVDYCKTRKQFGVAIGTFQALQHRMVDMFIGAEQARSILYRAICEYQQGDAGAAAAVAAMKAVVGRHGRHIAAEAIQLHGGMGMTEELDIGHYVRRLMLLEQLFGDRHAALREYCDYAVTA